MRSLVAATFSQRGSAASHRPLARLLGLAPAALLICGLFTVWAGPLAAPVAASAPTGVVVAWGNNGDGQTTVPAGLSGVTAIAAGGSHSLALESNGTVVVWGSNGHGQTDVPAGLSGVTAFAAGWDHSLALKSNGTVVAWGGSEYGQTDVPAGLSSVTAIAAGYDHSLALKSDGRVVAWGWDYYGQSTVPAGLSGVTAISAGRGHSLALKSDGTVVAWGRDDFGQTDVPASLSGVTAIDAGYDHSLALKSNGTVVAWGYNAYGQTAIPTGLAGVIAISAGGEHSLALKSNGTVVAWGYNAYGQSTIPTGLAGVIAISAGFDHSLAIEPSVAAILAVSGIASPYVAGVPHSVTVTAKDPDGNVAIGYRGRVHFTSTDPAAILPADYTFTSADAGVHRFALGLVLETVGSQSVTATDMAARSITGVQSGIVVTPNPVAALVVCVVNPYVAGAAHSVVVIAKDAGGNTYTAYRGTIHFTSTDPAAIMPADYTFTAADAGVHTFSLGLTFKTVGVQGVRARDTVATSITGAHYGIVVNPPAAATHLSVSGLPSAFVAGSGHSVTVTALDGSGNLASGYRGTIHFTSSDPAAVLPADYTFTAADAGSHKFTYQVKLKTDGTEWVKATDKVTATITGTQGGIVVS